MSSVHWGRPRRVEILHGAPTSPISFSSERDPDTYTHAHTPRHTQTEGSAGTHTAMSVLTHCTRFLHRTPLTVHWLLFIKVITVKCFSKWETCESRARNWPNYKLSQHLNYLLHLVAWAWLYKRFIKNDADEIRTKSRLLISVYVHIHIHGGNIWWNDLTLLSTKVEICLCLLMKKKKSPHNYTHMHYTSDTHIQYINIKTSRSEFI